MDELELIRQKINIVDLIQEYLPLKKSGVNFKATCPFHNEKTPSFMVSPERGIWHCFGCAKGGDIFKFVMEKEGVEFKEALEILAKKAGVVLTRVSKQKDQKERLFEANLKAQEFFHYVLTKHSLGKKALEYLTGRGVGEESIIQFGIGYAPNSWDSLTKFLTKRGFKAAEIIDSGLGVASKTSYYDRFRGRITFPLIDAKDRVIGFSGRVISSQEPKYINTPQTPIFDKSSYLFGINLARSVIRAKNEAILVEGEMDVILSFQSGIKNVVASKGTALTAGQIDLIKRYTDNISICFDMDLAGDSASRRGIEMADKAGLNIKIIQLKVFKDPAEAVVRDPESWQKAAKQSVPIYDYYIDSCSSRFNLSDPASFRKISQELIPVWAEISDDLTREHYIQKLSAYLKIDDKIIRQAINKQRKGAAKNYSEIFRQVSPKDNTVSPRSRRELLEEYLIALLLHIPKDHIYVPSFPETLFIAETLRQIYVLLVLYLDSISFKGKSFDINEFVQGLPPELTSEVDRLYLTELDDKLSEKSVWQKELDGVIAELKRALIKASLEKLAFEIKNAQEFGKMEVVDSLSKRFRDLSLKLRAL